MVEPDIGDTSPQGGVGGQRVGTGGIGEDAVINIAHGSQLCLQHNALACVAGCLQIGTGITDVRAELRRLCIAPVQKSLVGHRLLMITAGQLHVFGIKDHMQSAADTLLIKVQKIPQTQCLLRYLSL